MKIILKMSGIMSSELLLILGKSTKNLRLSKGDKKKATKQKNEILKIELTNSKVPLC